MFMRTLTIGGFVAASVLYSAAAMAAEPPPPPPADTPVAKVNGEVVNRSEFEAALVRAARQRFYHGKVEEARMEELRRDVLDEIVLERLLLKEVASRKVAVDLAEVEGKIKELDERYKTSEQWASQREAVLPEMRARMVTNAQKAALEQTIRTVAPPTDAQLQAFYDANKELFTEPQRDRVAVILLKVDPSSTKEVWDSAKDEAARIRAKIVAGTSTFADLAKLHSGDESASNGGDMGYLHQGMLAPEAEEALGKMKVGDLSEPVQILQGYTLFQLLDRKEPKLRSLDQVRQRASDLYLRRKGDEAWTSFTDSLRKAASIWVDPKVVAAK